MGTRAFLPMAPWRVYRAAYFQNIPFLLVLRFAISQARIAARTPTLMQGSDEKNKGSARLIKHAFH